jgi:hypothetical protein
LTPCARTPPGGPCTHGAFVGLCCVFGSGSAAGAFVSDRMIDRLSCASHAQSRVRSTPCLGSRSPATGRHGTPASEGPLPLLAAGTWLCQLLPLSVAARASPGRVCPNHAAWEAKQHCDLFRLVPRRGSLHHNDRIPASAAAGLRRPQPRRRSFGGALVPGAALCRPVSAKGNTGGLVLVCGWERRSFHMRQRACTASWACSMNSHGPPNLRMAHTPLLPSSGGTPWRAPRILA